MIAATPPPARVQVVAQEFRFALSRRTIEAGHAIIELRNAGEDAHDLLLQRVGGHKVWAWPVTRPSEIDEAVRYQLWGNPYIAPQDNRNAVISDSLTISPSMFNR